MSGSTSKRKVTEKWLNVNNFELDGVQVTATAEELNALDGITSSVSELNILDGVTATAAELNKVDGLTAVTAELDAAADGVANGAPTFVVGIETGGNVINVSIQLKDAAGGDVGTRQGVFAYLSDDANGDSIVATAPDSGWAIGTDGLLIPVVASKAAYLVGEADGDIDVNITHAGGAKTCYLILVLPNGKLAASGAITFAA